MDIQEIKNFAKNKIEADDLAKQVRRRIKETAWEKQNRREGFSETFKPLISQFEKPEDSKKENIFTQNQEMLRNQLALTEGIKNNQLAIKGLTDKQDIFNRGFKQYERLADMGELPGVEAIEDKEDEKDEYPIAKFKVEDFDKKLNNKESQDILKSMGHNHLPSYYFDISEISSLIDNVNQLKKTDKIDFRRYNRLRCSVPQPPKLYGLPKLHKPNIPMRPIVSFCGSPTYQLSKYLTNVLKLLTEESRHKLQSTENFIDAIKTIQIPDDHKLVSFDVKSLFTSIPLQLALDCTENAIKNSTAELPLPTDDIMDLLNLCLTSTYFQYNGKHYKQLHGTAMGSPVSVVVAEIVMQNIEEQALATYTRTIPIWLRYVDDTFTAVHKDGIDDFHEHLNRQNADIQFTKEIEENGKIPFLDCLVTRNNNKLQTTVYRKPTHTDRLLDQSSYNPTLTRLLLSGL